MTISGNEEATVSIIDNDVTIQFVAASFEAREGEEDSEGEKVGAKVLIQLTGGSPQQRLEIPIEVERQGGAMMSDYSLSGNPVIFPAGASEEELIQIITVIADDDEESDDDGESLLLTIGNLPDNVVKGNQAETTVHLTDDDGDPLKEVDVQFDVAPGRTDTTYSVTEGASVDVAISLSETPGRNVSVSIRATSNKASEGADGDYSFNTKTVTFAADANGAGLTKSITVTANDDNEDDDNETIELSFSTLPDRVTASGNEEATVSIIDNDVTVQFGGAIYTAIEKENNMDDTGDAKVVIQLTGGSPPQNLTIPIEVNPQGEKITDDDYLIKGFDDDDADNKTVTFQAGASGRDGLTKIITIKARTDNDADDDGEFLTLSFGNLPDGVVEGSQKTTTVRLEDRDGDAPTEVTVQFNTAPGRADATYSVAEGASVAVAISLSETPGRQITVPVIATPQNKATSSDYSISAGVTFAAAANGADLTQSIRITAANDEIDDDGETIALAFGALPPSVTAATPSTATVNIEDTDALTVSFGASSYMASEPRDDGSGGVTAQVEISLNVTPTTDVTIPITVRSPEGASEGEGPNDDYSIAGFDDAVEKTVTFAANSSDLTKSITITAAADNVDDDGETITLAFGALPSSVTATPPITATVTIVDSDDLRVSFGADIYRAIEGATAEVAISLSVTPTTDITIPITITEEEAGERDYTASARAVTFAANARGDGLTKRITVTAVDDSVNIEPDESLRLSFGTLPTGVEVGIIGTATVTIIDNDPLTVSFPTPMDPYLAVEDGADATVEIRLSGTPSVNVVISIVATATAENGASNSDYDLSTTSVAFPKETTVLTQRITVTATTDSDDDDGERLTLSFINLPDGVTALSSAATATVTFDEDDDGDGFIDSLDNCPQIANSGQENEFTPGDNKGDVCSLSSSKIDGSTASGPVLSNDDRFGSSVAYLGDLDGTGEAAAVLAVGAPLDDAGGDARGAVHLLYLNSNGTLQKTVEINDTTANGPDLNNGGNSGSGPFSDNFGSSVAYLGDLDGTGEAVAVLAVGAPFNYTGGSYRGAVHLLYLNSNGTVRETVEINDDTANGPDVGIYNQFGRSVASLGDLDGPDSGTAAAVLAVGNPAKGTRDGADRGAVHLLYLESDGTLQKTVEINDTTANGPALNDGDWFGISVASLGDLDGTDSGTAAAVLAVGAHRDDTGGSNRGAVYLLYLNSNGTVRDTVEINDTTANGPALNNEDRFGFSVANLGDLDGPDDGAATVLAVGAFGDDTGGTG